MLIKDECYRQIFTEQIKERLTSHCEYSKCSPLAWTHARRCLRHWSMASPITACSILVLSYTRHPDAVSNRPRSALSSGRLVATPGSKFYSQLDWDLSCSAATNPAKWKQESCVQDHLTSPVRRITVLLKIKNSPAMWRRLCPAAYVADSSLARAQTS